MRRMTDRGEKAERIFSFAAAAVGQFQFHDLLGFVTNHTPADFFRLWSQI